MTAANTLSGILARCVAEAGPLDSPCLIPPHVGDRHGYVRAKIHGRKVYVHVLVWEEAHGALPPGWDVDHRCRRRSCANIVHLEGVTHRENVLRGDGPAAVNARKTVCKRGHDLKRARIYRRPDGRIERICDECCRAREIARAR